MNIIDFSVQPFQLFFINPFETSIRTYFHRRGYLIKIVSDNFVGLGECSPLFGLSKESIQEAGYALESYRLALKDMGRTSINELLALIPIHSQQIASVEFGLEIAIYDLASKMNKKPLYKYLNKEAARKIYSNGIVGIHGEDEGYHILKVKMGSNNLFKELAYLDKLTNKYGNEVKFRLDFNGCMDLPRAIRFCKEIEKFNIDYIEQPLPAHELEDLSELRYHTEIPIAADESLKNIEDAEKIIEFSAVDICIIKPSIIGGFNSCKDIVNLVESEGLRWLVTSTLEANVGLCGCMHFASALGVKETCGLSTNTIYKDNIAKDLFIFKDGVILLSNDHGLGTSNDFDR